MTFVLFIFAAVAQAAQAAVSPVAPWWAAPLERVLIEWGRALVIGITSGGPVSIWAFISNRQHKKTLETTEEAKQEAINSRVEIRSAIKEVHNDLLTGNAATVGQLASLQESRRVEEKAPEERTTAEQEHLNSVPTATASVVHD